MSKLITPAYIIALGASAGGVEALFEFFDNTLPDAVAYVVTTHLAPHHKSHLSELIQRHSAIEVIEVKDQVRVASNVVYVMPENQVMRLKAGRLVLTPRDLTIKINLAIDIFFCSLAEDRQFEKIGVILSGLGSDGTKGSAALTAQGAWIIAQQPGSAIEASMPMSVIDSGYSGAILSPAAMPQAIIDHIVSKSECC